MSTITAVDMPLRAADEVENKVPRSLDCIMLIPESKGEEIKKEDFLKSFNQLS